MAPSAPTAGCRLMSSADSKATPRHAPSSRNRIVKSPRSRGRPPPWSKAFADPVRKPTRPCGRHATRRERTDSRGAMVTRDERIEAFSDDGDPPAEQPLELLCEDHNGTYVIPFACRLSGGAWKSMETGCRIEVTVIGWRLR